MSDFVKDLEHNVEKDADARRRRLVIQHLADQSDATIEDLFNVCENSKLGDVMKTITLGELRGMEGPSNEVEEEEEEGEEEAEEVAAAPARGRKKTAKKKTSKKTSKANGKTNGASTRGKKPRLDYNAMQKEVLKYMRAAKAPVSTGDVSRDLGMTGPQARKIFENLQGEKQVKRIGKGGRATKYELR